MTCGCGISGGAPATGRRLRRASHDDTGERTPAGVPAVIGALPLTAAHIYLARRRLRGVAAVTPVLSSPALDEAAGRPLVCKAESLQLAGSFKFRGAYNA